jgi:hypothetical protein
MVAPSPQPNLNGYDADAKCVATCRFYFCSRFRRRSTIFAVRS